MTKKLETNLIKTQFYHTIEKFYYKMHLDIII